MRPAPASKSSVARQGHSASRITLEMHLSRSFRDNTDSSRYSDIPALHQVVGLGYRSRVLQIDRRSLRDCILEMLGAFPLNAT